MKSLMPILIMSLAVAMYFMFISPSLSEIKGLNLKKAEFINVLTKAEELKAKRDEILTEYNNIPEEQIERLNKIIPATYDSVAFANDVNNLTTQYGLAIKGIRDISARPGSGPVVVGEGTTAPLYRTNIVTIIVAGNYEQFVQFLDNLESNLRLIDVKSLSIRSTSDPKTLVENYEFTLEVSIYSLN